MSPLRRLGAGLLTGLAMALSADALANAEISVAAGATSESTTALQAEIAWPLPLARLHERLGLRLGTGLVLLPGDDGDDNAAWLLGPTLRWTFASERRPFLEAGIGAALFYRTRLETRELASAFQFQDRLALGLPLGQGELALSLTHYSNAGIKAPNDGFETLTLGYHRQLR